MKDILKGKIMTDMVSIRSKMCSYITDDDHVDKKAKGTKKVRYQTRTKILKLKKCLQNNETIIK